MKISGSENKRIMVILYSDDKNLVLWTLFIVYFCAVFPSCVHTNFWLGIEHCSNRRRNLVPEESSPRFAWLRTRNWRQKNGVYLWRQFQEHVLCVLPVHSCTIFMLNKWILVNVVVRYIFAVNILPASSQSAFYYRLLIIHAFLVWLFQFPLFLHSLSTCSA